MSQQDSNGHVSDRKRELRLDEIGYWSEVKLDIIKEYATKYTTIMAKQREKGTIQAFAYIDAFSGAGIHVSKRTGEYVLGSPLNALEVRPPFTAYYFIDLNSVKSAALRETAGRMPNVRVFDGDCNDLLLSGVFPEVRYDDYRRALCLLDPYSLDLSWDVIKTAGQMRSIDMFLNFPMMDMNRNVLWHDPQAVDSEQAARMTRYWGDESWRKVAYQKDPDLFDVGRLTKVADANEVVAGAFRTRLRTAAGFANVPPPLPMRNSNGATVYYLFFASQKDVANNIVSHIFKKYADRCAPPLSRD